jgi:hypothetical protein
MKTYFYNVEKQIAYVFPIRLVGKKQQTFNRNKFEANTNQNTLQLKKCFQQQLGGTIFSQ